ncbi:MAG: phage tail protein [Oscillospiraceae bacterium]|nr:phage tail protein [Oscillospiraceae bacterium]
MSNTVSNVSAGKPKIGGAVFRAPVGTPLPTTASAELDAAFKDLGFVSDAGVTNSSGVTTNAVKSWGGDTVLTTQESRDDAFAMTLIESLNAEVLKAFHGDEGVSGELATGIVVKASGRDLGTHSYVIDMVMRDRAVKRIVIPNAMVSETGDVVYSDNDVVGYPLTLSAQPDADGNTHYEYIQRAAASSGDVSEEPALSVDASEDAAPSVVTPEDATSSDGEPEDIGGGE